MGRKHDGTSQFCLEGRFLKFLLEDGYKVRYLQLATPSGEHWIKLKKEARASLLGQALKPGEWIQVSGYQKQDKKSDRVELKACRVSRMTPRSGASADGAIAPVAPVPTSTAKSKAATILVCQKSDCCKRGGTAMTKALESELKQRNLTDQVKIRGTGCMKQCKAGPNLVMPDKTRYSRVRPDEISALVDKHLGSRADQDTQPQDEMAIA